MEDLQRIEQFGGVLLSSAIMEACAEMDHPSPGDPEQAQWAEPLLTLFR